MRLRKMKVLTHQFQCLKGFENEAALGHCAVYAALKAVYAPSPAFARLKMLNRVPFDFCAGYAALLAVCAASLVSAS